MSLKTWKKEFYPVPATSPKTKITAIKHSLRKWKGLTKENLKKHDVSMLGYTLLESNSLEGLIIDAHSCALCQLYIRTTNGDEYDEDDLEFIERCYKCPLYKLLGKSCDDDFKQTSPFSAWANKSDPQPMIKALEKTLANETSSKTSR